MRIATRTQQSSSKGSDAYGRRSQLRLVDLADVEAAARRIVPYVVTTPLLTSKAIDGIVSQAVSSPGGSKVPIKLCFKAEHLQVVGAFKARGAANAIQTSLCRLQSQNPGFDRSKLCVLTHSSGNHGAALACQAKQAGVQAAVVMPSNAPAAKKNNVTSYGARVWYCEPLQEAREAMAREACQQLESEGYVVEFVHPFDDAAIIAGQGTMAREMLLQVPELQVEEGRTESMAESDSPRADKWPAMGGARCWQPREAGEAPLDIVIAPVGGGGMLSGVCTAVKAMSPQTLVVGAEPSAADDAQRSFATHELQPAIPRPQTICDGLLTSLSELTLAHIERRVDMIATASDSAVLWALNVITTKMKQIIEPSAAMGLAALLENEELQKQVRQVHSLKVKDKNEDQSVRIGIVWSGGNVTVQTLAEHLSKQ